MKLFTKIIYLCGAVTTQHLFFRSDYTHFAVNKIFSIKKHTFFWCCAHLFVSLAAKPEFNRKEYGIYRTESD